MKRIQTKTALIISGLTIGFGGMIMALAMPLGANAAVGGPICNVPADYSSIQAAVSVPGCTTVNVAAGTYTENVVISHSLILNGAQAGVDARGRVATETIINGGTGANITITADNVTVDGFTLNGPTSSGTAALVMQTANSGETVQNNIINNPGRAASITTSNTAFRKNVVNNNATSSDGFQANTTPVHDLTISDNNFSGANPAIYNADITVIEGNTNVVVSGNKSNGDGTLIALFKTNSAQITKNTVVGDSSASAIYIGGADSNVNVSGNKVSAAASAIKVSNAFSVGVNSSVTVTGNTLQNNQYGVNVAANSENSTVSVHKNSITGNTVFGVNNDPTSGTSTLDGTCNWWGAANGPGPVGPGTGDKVSAGVTFSPWLTSSNLNGSCAGGLPHPVTKADCKDGGWKNFTNDNGKPFKNKDQCIDYVVNHQHKISGDVKYNAYGLNRHAEFDMNTADNSGSFEYSDVNGGSYKVKVSSVKVSGSSGWFAGVVTKASDPSWVGQWLFAEVKDNSPDQIWGSFTDQTTAQNGVSAMTNPADGPFNVSKGNLKVN